MWPANSAARTPRFSAMADRVKARPPAPIRHGLPSHPIPSPLSPVPHRLQILPHPLSPALAPEPRLPVPAEPRRGIEQVGAVDPNDARFDLRRDVERQVDVLRP